MPRLFLSVLLVTTLLACKKSKTDPPAPPPYVPIKLESSSFILGNREKGILDTFYLRFNKSIRVDQLLLVNNGCLPDMRRSISADSTTVKFYNILCTQLGHDYTFEFIVQDREGKTLKDTARFSFYTRKLPTQGLIVNYFLSADNKFVWVLTQDPNQVYCIDLENPANTKKYPLNFTPGKMVLNPANQKLYILNYFVYTMGATNLDKIYVMNPADGKIERTITVPLDAYDNPQHHVVLYNLAFGYNGYGILETSTRENSSGTSRWRILDSRYRDTVYVHPAWKGSVGGGNLPFALLWGSVSNYNGSKIYLRRSYSYPRGAVMDVNSETMTEMIYPSTNPSHFIVPSRKHDKLFIASYGYQTIIGAGSPQYFSPFDNRYSETADFSYRAGDNNVIYYRGREDFPYFDFMILDYNLGKTLMKTYVGSDFNNILATTDGKYVLAVVGGQVVLFEVEWFYRWV